ncbi:MAG: DUF2249 domain-containing protein [Salinirussus sp.]
MAPEQNALEVAGAPPDRPREVIEAADLPPPGPLKRTLERLESVDDEVVLVQRNDRVPQHLFPQLDDRGYRYETIEGDKEVVTVIWRSDIGD